jgi:hypothetical protein
MKLLRYWSLGWWLHRFRLSDPPSDADAEEASHWRQREEEALERAHQQGAEVDRIAGSLEQHRHDNHFSELLMHAFRSGV